MKKTLLALCTALALSPVAFASNASDDSAMSALSVASVAAVGIASILAAPVLSVISISQHATQSEQMMVEVETENGRTVSVPVNKSAAQRAGLQRGDKLTAAKRKSGVLLNKEGKPVAFLVPAENEKLTTRVAPVF